MNQAAPTPERMSEARGAVVAGTDEPVEGLRIWFLVPEVLSEADVDEFTTRMDGYPF